MTNYTCIFIKCCASDTSRGSWPCHHRPPLRLWLCSHWPKAHYFTLLHSFFCLLMHVTPSQIAWKHTTRLFICDSDIALTFIHKLIWLILIFALDERDLRGSITILWFNKEWENGIGAACPSPTHIRYNL